MSEVLFYNGSIIDEKHKERRGFFFIEELFVGDFFHKAPASLRKKLDDNDLENIETGVKSYFGTPFSSKIVFQNYAHFRRVLDEVGISLKQYYQK
jgi:hypothetical protein